MSKPGDNEPMAPRRSLSGPSPMSEENPTEEVPVQQGASRSDGRADDAQARESQRRDAERRETERRDAEQRDAERRESERRDAEARENEQRQAEQKRQEQEEASRAKAEAREQKQARKAKRKQPRQIRRAKLRLTRVDPWSVTKTAFLLSIAFGIMCVVAVFLIFSIMNAAGLWDNINQTVLETLGKKTAGDFDVSEYVGMSRVMGITVLIAVVDVVILTALATLGAFIYNMSAAMLGGIEVTLAEDLN